MLQEFSLIESGKAGFGLGMVNPSVHYKYPDLFDENPTATIKTAGICIQPHICQDRVKLLAWRRPLLKSLLAAQQLIKPQHRQQEQFYSTRRRTTDIRSMTLTHSVQQEFLDNDTNPPVCIPSLTSAFNSPMAVSGALCLPVSALGQQPFPTARIMLLQTAVPLSSSPMRIAESRKGERWTEDEHERFLLGIELFKAGPWKKIAGVVGTRDARQTMSHAQKYRQKIKRHKLPQRRAHHGSRTTSTTKRLQIARVVETLASGEADVDNRVVGNARSQLVPPRVQLPCEVLGDAEGVTTGFEEGLERVTGLIPAETLPGSSGVNVGSNARTLDGVMVGAGTGRGDRLNQQLDATLEPLDSNADISVVYGSWLMPDELTDFFNSRCLT